MNSGSTYSLIPTATGISASALSWSWNIATNTELSTKARVKIVDEADPTVYDESNKDFVVKGSLSLNTPSAAGILLYVGNAYDITWTKLGAIANVRLEYSTDNGSTYPNLIVASTDAAIEKYTWSIPDQIKGNVLKVKVTDVDNSAVSDTSDNNFEIVGKVSLDVPDGGQTWVVGTTQAVKWTPTGTYTYVHLEYSIDGGTTYSDIVAQTAAGESGVQQSYNWSIPDKIGSNLRVRVSDPDHHPDKVKDVSTGTFTIVGSLDLTAPDGGEVWYVGETNRAIAWNSTGTINLVKIEYSVNNGGSWNTITESASGGQGAFSYTWASVADVKSETCLMRVSDPAYPDVKDTSLANFSIRPEITVSEPLSGADLVVLSNNNPIKWNRTGTTISLVNIEYSVDGGTYTTIENNVDAAIGETPFGYSWNSIPDRISGNVKVKVYDAANSKISGVSPVFHIVGGLSLTAPVGGENWKTPSSTNTITWNRTGSIANAKLYYSTNSGSSYPNYIATVPAADGSYVWTPMPEAVTNTARVKITDASNETVVYDTSDSNFAIIGTFEVTSPANGNVLTSGDSYNITWSKTGTGIPNVNLSYSTDGGSGYTFIATAANTGSYGWSVPDTLSTDCKVKV